MASYAEVASHGPEQPDEEVIRPAVPHSIPEIAHDDSSVHSLNSQGSINLKNPVPSYADQGRQAEQQANDTAKQAEQKTKQATSKTSETAQDMSKQAGRKIDEYEHEGQKTYNNVKKEAQNDYNNVKKEVQKDYKEVKKQAGAKKEEVKKNAKKAEQWADDNKQNPVVIGNAVVVTALAGLIGIGAYRKYVAGELTWKVAGTWAGVVGLFAVGDYHVSSWLFKNKYPPKN